MAEKTGIAWTATILPDGTWVEGSTHNEWIGCTKIAPECAKCYAEVLDDRFGGGHWGKGAPRKHTTESNRNKPYAWNRQAKSLGYRRKVFCSSLSDVFDSEVDPEWRVNLFKTIKDTINLDWLLLTKRPENIMSMVPSDWGDGYPNVWMGTSVGTNKTLDKIDTLGLIPSKVKFISVEPQLEYIDFSKWFNMNKIPFDQLIFGGESGFGARPFDPNWIRESLAMSRGKNVAIFVKQMGTYWFNQNYERITNVLGKNADRKGGDIEFFDEDLRIREFPKNGMTELFDIPKKVKVKNEKNNSR